MAEETNDGITYLKALKQAVVSQSGVASAPAREQERLAAAPQNAENFQGAEKRRSPRYKCEGSAELREEGCDVRTWATFTDIGLHGCYVEAQATYPAGTLLHMKLEVNGVRFEAKGKVRISYPYLGMGIAFEDLSEDNNTRSKAAAGQPFSSGCNYGARGQLAASHDRTNGGHSPDHGP